MPFQIMEKAQLFLTAKLYRRSRRLRTSITERLVSYCANSGWQYRMRANVLHEVSMVHEKFAKSLREK